MTVWGVVVAVHLLDRFFTPNPRMPWSRLRWINDVRNVLQVRILGKGSYGVVILALRQVDSVPVAIKFMRRGDKVELLPAT